MEARSGWGRALRELAARILPLLGITMIRRSREEEVAVGYNMIASCLIAGIILVLARPIADWLTGGRLSNPPVAEMGEMIGKVFDLIMYLGVVIIVIGLMLAGINLLITLAPAKSGRATLAVGGAAPSIEGGEAMDVPLEGEAPSPASR